MQPFVGQIMTFSGSYVVLHYGACSGAVLPIYDHQQLYALLGTMYGGDGRSNFALPDLRGRIPIHRNVGQPGTVWAPQGAFGGVEAVALDVSQMPLHTHTWQTAASTATTDDPTDRLVAKSDIYANETDRDPKPLYSQSVGSVGNGVAHSNIMPFLAISFQIALQGIFPSRN